jgi:predicted nucleic acid-binding protein
MMRDFPRLVLDANIMLSALLGKSFPMLLQMVERGIHLFAPEPQIAEVRKELGRRANASPTWVAAQLARLETVIIPLPTGFFEVHEERARSRLGERGQPDWPVIAASFETAAGIWSHDKDFFGSGSPVWSMRVLRRQMELADV